MAINSTTPILTAVAATDASYDAPSSAQVIAQTTYGMQTIWTGPGGTFEIRPYGNLLSLAGLSTPGFLYLESAGTLAPLNVTAGTGVNIVRSGANFVVSVAPDTTLQKISGEYNSIAFGSPRSVINIVAGSGIGISTLDTGTSLNWTLSSTGAPDTANYVVTTANADLPQAFNLGALTTGLLKVTVSGATGTPSIATGNTDYMLANSKMIDLYDSAPAAGSLFYYTGGHWVSIAPSATTGQVLSTLSSTTIGWVDTSAYATDWSVYPATQNVDFDGFKGVNALNPTSAQDVATKAYVDSMASGSVTLAGANVWTGTNTFNTNLPTSTATPTTSTQLTTKAYTDGTFVALTGAQTIAGVKTFSSAPVMSGASITASTVPVAAVVGTAGALSGANAWTGTNTFNTNLPTSTVTPTTSTQLITKAYADNAYSAAGSNVALGGTNAWTGTNSYNTNLPTSTLTPSSSTQLTTKAYVDSVAGSGILLSGANAWTGTNTYNTNLPTSVLTPSLSTQLTTKAYVDSMSAGSVTWAGTNPWTGTNTFNTLLPTSTVTPSGATDLTTKAYTDATFVALAGAQTVAGVKTFSSAPVMSGASITAGTIAAAGVSGVAGTLSGVNAWTGTNTFNTALPTSTVTPSASTDLITKAYADATYSAFGAVTLSGTNAWTGTNSYNTALPTSTLTPAASTDLTTKAYTDATFVALTGAQTVAGVKTFTSNPKFSSGATVSYVPVCSNVDGTWAWAPPEGAIPATVTTSDATPTTLLSVPLTTNAMVTLSGTVSATTADYATVTLGGSHVSSAVRASGSASLISTPVVIVMTASAASFNVVVSGNDLIVQVTGVAGQTINWKTEYNIVTL